MLGVLVLHQGACRSACLDADKPLCVDRYDGTWLVVHRMRAQGLGHRDVRDADAGESPVLSLRGDASLGVQWEILRTGETWALGFPDAGAVGITPVPRGEGSCSATVPRVLTYVPDDTLARQPRLQVQTTGCAGTPTSSDVLFVGPSDFGRQILAWEHEESWDLWVAAPSEGLGRGALFRFGNAPERDPDARTFGDAQMIEGPAAGDGLGTRLARCGDIDGDGLDELAVGMPGYGTEQGAARAGAVVILTPDALPAEGDWSLEDADTIVWGEAEDGAGTDVLCDADLTGDGVPDLVIGGPGADGAQGADAGAVWVVPGLDIPAGALSGSDAIVWQGGAAGEGLGASLAVGDLDGDGRPDLAAGAPGSAAAGEGTGAIRVLYSTALTDTPEPGPIFTGRPARDVDGIAASARLGARVGVGDLDQDGRPELLGGAWRADRDGLRLHAGEILGWSGSMVSDALGGSEADVALSVEGTASHQEVGRVLRVEDIDNDGTVDIVTAARRRAR